MTQQMGNPYPLLGFVNGVVRNVVRFAAIPRDRGESIDVVNNPFSESNRG